MNEDELVYDIFLFSPNGVALIARCTGTAYCKAHAQQHRRYSDLLWPVYQAAKETTPNLNTLISDEIQINFKVDDTNRFTLALIHSKTAPLKKIGKALTIALDIFMRKCLPEIEKLLLSPYQDWDLNLVKDSYLKDLAHAKIIPSEVTYSIKEV